MIKNIVFDFGGVLVQHDFMTFFAKILGSKEKVDWFMQNVLPEKVNNDIDMELHEPSYYIEQQKRLWPEYTEALDAFDKHYTDIFIGESEGIRDLMLKLKADGYRLLGLSNWSSRVYDVMAKFDIFNLIEGSIISKDVHQLKPNKDIYMSFLQKFNVKADECVFIDDRPDNIEGCKAVGMPGIVFRNTQQLTQELNKLLPTRI
ncbi:MAG: HAD-IA family hydrolase [Prevotella sp.]|nr:HAD-IA family hydrolase [Prevotella sp.]